jgi:general stress protein 26
MEVIAMHRILSFAFVVSMLFIPITFLAQEDLKQPALERSNVIAAARKLMEKARMCALITIGENGQPQARVVDPFLPEDDMSVWIGTNSRTRKLTQIRKERRVTLFYLDPSQSGYVTLLGTAEVITDSTEKEKHWKSEWSSFFSNKNKGEDYVLIHFKPFSLEIVSYPDSLVNDPVTWRPVQIDFRQGGQ